MVMRAAYWAGCTFKHRFPEIVEAHLRLLKRAGIEAELVEEGCCGDLLLLAGLRGRFIEVARRAYRRLEGYDLVVTECAGCYHAFRRYGEVGVGELRVKHLSQALVERLSSLRLRRTEERVAYHDPCELGRLSGVYEEPRALLRAIAVLVEPRDHGPRARCCGGGGGLWAACAELSLAMAEELVRREIEPLGVSKLVTACPTCLLNLSIASMRLGSQVEVVDLGSLVESMAG